MRINTLYFKLKFMKFVVIAITIFLVNSIAITRSQERTPEVSNFNSVLNGLFSPNAGERFFQEGRDNFELQIKILSNPELYFNGDLLRIDPELVEQIQTANPSKIEFNPFNASRIGKSIFTIN